MTINDIETLFERIAQNPSHSIMSVTMDNRDVAMSLFVRWHIGTVPGGDICAIVLC
jgi:hypothetical protein